MYVVRVNIKEENIEQTSSIIKLIFIDEIFHRFSTEF